MNSKKRRTVNDGAVSGPDIQPTAPHRARSGSRKKVKNNLVALGSAAVLAVYAAGYLRTRSAAQRFERDADERRPPVSPTGIASGHAAILPPVVEPVAPAGDPMSAVEHSQPSNGTLSPEIPPAPAAVSTAAPPVTPEPVTAPAVVIAADSPPTPTAAAPAIPAATPATDSSSTGGAGQTAEATAQPADTKRDQYKDGTYFGWGRCRHGRLQACVEIKAGRIIFASISECRTRYSCDVISLLPPQVVARQSSDVDYISGATESADAFHDAVMEALDNAK